MIFHRCFSSNPCSCAYSLLHSTVLVATALLILTFAETPVFAQGPMKLLSPNAGWLRDIDTLYLTRDNGDHWSNITPQLPGAHSTAALGPVFFRDASEGWAIVSHPDGDNPSLTQDQKATYSVMHTENGGESWAATPFVYPKLPDWVEETYSGPVSLFFLDSTHGWADVGFMGLSRPGKLLATQDGGQTWNWVGSPSRSGQVMFSSPNDGWLISSWGADELYATHDGAKSWNKVILSPPQNVGPARSETFLEPPTMRGNVGYLAVNYSGGETIPAKLVVYLTRSGGRTWLPVKSLQVRGDSPFAFPDSVLVVPTVSDKVGQPSTTIISLANDVDGAEGTYGDGVSALSFADQTAGWALNSIGQLYATHDGGLTWKNIGPIASARSKSSLVLPTERFETTRTAAISSTPLSSQAGTGIGISAHVSKHLGFDMSRVRTTAEMNTWWKSSPYYDTSLYLPGALNRGTDPNLTSSWVNTVKGQGWGFLPIWFGQQAPCAIATFSYAFTTLECGDWNAVTAYVLILKMAHLAEIRMLSPH